MRSLTLSEYQTLPGVVLSIDEVHALQRLRSAISVTPSLDVTGAYDLTANSWVGVVNLHTLAIEIRPKVTLDHVLFMVSYSLDRRGLRDSLADLRHDDTLVEAVALAFATLVQRAVRRGLLQDYRAEEDALSTVRGRIRFDEQLRRHYARIPPVDVRYDDFTVDILENRLIKAALGRLTRIRLRSMRARRALGILAQTFENVQTAYFDSRNLPNIQFTRRNERYRASIALAKFILQGMAYELHHGGVFASAFLVDMNKVFEDFVVVALRESLRLSQRSFPQESSGHPLRLDKAGLIHLYPDMSWWHGTRCRFVGDAKYKLIDTDGARNSDVYQVLAYTIATNLPAGLLIYAAGETVDTTHQIVHLGKRIEVRALDLSGAPEEMLGQIDAIASRIREMAGEGNTVDPSRSYASGIRR